MSKTEPKKFEEAFERLSEIVDQLETGDAGLEESLKLYAEGMKLAQLCGQKLTEAEAKIEELTAEARLPSDNELGDEGADD